MINHLRQKIRLEKHKNEEEAVKYLLEDYPLDTSARQAIQAAAVNIVKTSRSKSAERGTLDAFMQEFGLNNQEGVALMCLAEALLRIPDDDTQEDLIAEKMLSGNWSGHKGQSDNPLVNASVWALMLTGRVINMDRVIGKDPAKWLQSMIGKMGEPVIREAIMAAMRIMGRQFVYGRTIKDALKRQKKQPAIMQLHSFDMLGEGARTEAAAQRYQALYLQAIEAVGNSAKPNSPHTERSSISIKLSALHPRYEATQKDRVMAELLPRLEELAARARDFDMGLTIDAEEADRLDISLDLFEALAKADSLKNWDGLGLAVQAYQKRAPLVIDFVTELARESKRRIPIRLVKGAYWDSEIKHTQELGLEDYPVWTRKANTDLCYLATAAKMLKAPDAIYSQFATHNAHTIATIAHLAKNKLDDMEYQRLHGMGDLLYKAASETVTGNARVRIYAPVGLHEDLLPYLVRRLLENGANSSFVNRFMDEGIPVEEVAVDPYEDVSKRQNKRHGAIPKPVNIYGDRKNSTGIDLMDMDEQKRLQKVLSSLSDQQYKALSLVCGKPAEGKAVEVFSPQNQSDILGKAIWADKASVNQAAKAAHESQLSWDRLGGEKRAEILENVADLLEENRDKFLSIICREAGRTIADGLSEVREAADFCRYYAKEAREKFSKPQRLVSATGESNDLSLHGRGVFVCISPWNFPLAIFTGQIAAALAAGNGVLAKPAEQTPIVGYEAIKLFHKAGVPENVLHYLIGAAEVGSTMVSHPLIAGVAFTGSTQTAKIIQRALAAKEGPVTPLIAETGGQNVMIVDSSALPEQISDDVMISAFSSAGQRCSALRVLYVQDSIADKVIAMLKGALKERKVGNPADLSTDVGPIIDETALKKLKTHIKWMKKEATFLAAADTGKECDNGTFIAPHIFEIPSITMLKEEVFGPILHICRYKLSDLDKVLEDIRNTGYGLTFGVHSRIEHRWLDLFAKTNIGNAYINRNMIGAVVGVQPFGGKGLSGTGPKAGGPHYLYRFATEKVLTINTTAIGGNTDLFRLKDEDSTS